MRRPAAAAAPYGGARRWQEPAPRGLRARDRAGRDASGVVGAVRSGDPARRGGPPGSGGRGCRHPPRRRVRPAAGRVLLQGKQPMVVDPLIPRRILELCPARYCGTHLRSLCKGGGSRNYQRVDMRQRPPKYSGACGDRGVGAGDPMKFASSGACGRVAARTQRRGQGALMRRSLW